MQFKKTFVHLCKFIEILTKNNAKKMEKKIQKDANAQGASNVAEQANVNVKPNVVVSTEPKKAEEVTNTESTVVVTDTTTKQPKERKYRGILPSDNEAEHYGYKVGDMVSYIVTQGGHRVYGWVTNLRIVPKNGRSCAVVQIDVNQPVNYKRLEVYTTRLTKEESKPNPFFKEKKEDKPTEVVAVKQAEPIIANLEPTVAEVETTTKPSTKKAKK